MIAGIGQIHVSIYTTSLKSKKLPFQKYYIFICLIALQQFNRIYKNCQGKLQSDWRMEQSCSAVRPCNNSHHSFLLLTEKTTGFLEIHGLESEH